MVSISISTISVTKTITMTISVHSSHILAQPQHQRISCHSIHGVRIHIHHIHNQDHIHGRIHHSSHILAQQQHWPQPLSCHNHNHGVHSHHSHIHDRIHGHIHDHSNHILARQQPLRRGQRRKQPIVSCYLQ